MMKSNILEENEKHYQEMRNMRQQTIQLKRSHTHKRHKCLTPIGKGRLIQKLGCIIYLSTISIPVEWSIEELNEDRFERFVKTKL